MDIILDMREPTQNSHSYIWLKSMTLSSNKISCIILSSKTWTNHHSNSSKELKRKRIETEPSARKETHTEAGEEHMQSLNSINIRCSTPPDLYEGHGVWDYKSSFTQKTTFMAEKQPKHIKNQHKPNHKPNQRNRESSFSKTGKHQKRLKKANNGNWDRGNLSMRRRGAPNAGEARICQES